MADPITIGALCPVAGGFFFGGILSGVARAAAAAGGRVVSIQTLDPGLDSDHKACLGAPPFSLPIGWSHIDGFVGVAEAVRRPYLERLRATGKPIVTISNEYDFECPNVIPDNHGGIMAAVAHLVAHGHRRIAFVGNMAQNDICERYAAYQAGLREHGIDADPCLVFPSEDNLEAGGAKAGRALLSAGMPSTAVLAATDRNAIGIMRALRDAGLSLPQDQAIVSFDDVEEAAQLHPALSTVHVHFDRLGELAGELVLQELAGECLKPSQYPVATSFVVRESCGCYVATSQDAVSESEQPGGSMVTRSATAGMAPAGAGVRPSAVEQLTSRLRAILLPESDPPASIVRQFADAIDALVDAFDRAARDGRPAGAAHVAPLAEAFYVLGMRRETIFRVLSALQDYLADLTAIDSLLCDSQLALEKTQLALVLAIGQIETREHTSYRVRLERAMTVQYEVGMALLRSDQNDPGALSWFERTNASLGCVGLWADGPKGACELLRITGVYGTSDDLSGLIGTRMPVEHFPPAALIDRVNGAAGEVLFVVSVRAGDSFWGLLAAPAVINVHSTSAREALNHWAALLAVSLEQRDRRGALAAGYQRERKLVDSLRTSEERYALAARAANDGLWDWNLAEDTIYYSARWSALLGHREQEVGADPDEWFKRVHPDDKWGLTVVVRECCQGVTPVLEHEHRVRVADGSYRWMLCRALAIREDGAIATRMVGSLTDIDDRKALEEQLRFGASYDALTGLANRTLFLDRLGWAVEHAKRRPDARFAVLFCDLDGFKVINDSLGHLVGDLLLTRVAARIVEAIRSTDVAARLGGDEFAILLNDADLAEVPDVVRRVQDSIGGTPFDLDGQVIVVTASIGVALSTTGYENAADVLRDSDTAMYQAKSRERGTYQVFDVKMHKGVVNRLRVEMELRQAFEHQQFELHYQPMVDLDSDRVCGFEALLRWRHPERGFVLPREFLDVAEETGLTLPLGKWIIEEACRQIAQWRAASGIGAVPAVSINVSNRQFWHGGLLEQTKQALDAHWLEPDCLRFEITEGVIMHRPDPARRTMEDLYRHGIRLHIDDFGTGYSSLDSLHRFPIDALKIDQSFIAACGSNDIAPELIRAIIGMGRAIGVSVIAEGVETVEQVVLLRRLGCHVAQGHHFGRPLPGSEISTVGILADGLRTRS